jgi:hypothetical protein
MYLASPSLLLTTSESAGVHQKPESAGAVFQIGVRNHSLQLKDEEAGKEERVGGTGKTGKVLLFLLGECGRGDYILPVS